MACRPATSSNWSTESKTTLFVGYFLDAKMTILIDGVDLSSLDLVRYQRFDE